MVLEVRVEDAVGALEVAVQIEVMHVEDEAVAHGAVVQPWSGLAGKPHCTVPLF